MTTNKIFHKFKANNKIC